MFDSLIDSKVLFEQLDSRGWCLIDCRASLTDPVAGSTAYAAGHIPGALFADLATDLSGLLIAGVTGRHPLPDPPALAATFGRWGVDAGTQVVAYDAGNGAYAARAWWLFRWLGHSAVAVLNGGLAAWQAEGYLLRSVAEYRAPATFPVRATLTRLVSVAEVIDRGASMDLVDARAEARFRGEVEPIDPVAGHIPGARCLPFEGNLGSDGRFAPPEVLRRRFEAGLNADRELVCYCGSGVTACHNILAMRYAGLPEATLYAGSFSEWIRDPARPVER